MEPQSALQLAAVPPFPETAVGLEVNPAFIEALPLAIYACDADGRILWFNTRAATLWGRSPQIGSASEKYCGSYRLYFNGREISRDETPMAMVLQTGIPIRGVEGKVERPDGSSVWAMVHIEPVRDVAGKLIGAINCFHEITALREAEARLAATYENAGSGIAEIDSEGRFLRVNARLGELMDRLPEDLIGRSIFDETFAGDVEHDRDQFLRQVAGEFDRYTIEKRIPKRDGTFFWASVTSSSVRGANGKFLYAVRIQHDITAQRRIQDELAARGQEQAAIHRLIDRLQRARSLTKVHELALDAILEALRCRRASILLFDKTDVIRFVAWRGLSDGYRAAVDGHSPWKAGEENPQPLTMKSVEESDLPDALKAVIRGEGIGAAAFIPILDSGRLLGKFMAYYDQPHQFSENEIEVAQAIAHQLGFAIERTRAQKARQQLVSIVEYSHDAIVSKDLDGVIVTWNSGAERLFGYTADEVIGKPITVMVPDDRLDEENMILTRIRAGQSVDLETVRRHKDGSLIDISLTVSPVRDVKGRVIGASKIARDIGERKEAEAKLRESERRFQDLLAAVPAAIYTTDAEGRITYFNRAAVELAGRVPTLGTDKWCVTWKLYRPDGTPLPHDEYPMALSLKEGKPVRGVEAVAERPDGTRVPFIPYPTPMRDSKGKVVGGINMLVDISERKQAETQQRILLNELNHRVKNNMQMLQSLLFTSARRSRSEEARRTLEEASARIAAMAAAQRVLYDTIDATRFDAAQFLAAVCQTAQQAFPSHVRVVSTAEPGQLSNDIAMPLALVVNELLTNAVKHGASADRDAEIRVRLVRIHESYHLTVEDDGPGYDLEAVRPKSSGLRLVEGLARQIRGTFSVATGPATRCTLTFHESTN